MSDENQTMTLTEDKVEETVEFQSVEPQVEEEVEVKEEAPKVLRTASDGCFEVYEGAWGKYLRPCFDPDANVEITKEHLEYFEVNPDIHKVPAELWSRWTKLCFHYVGKVKDSVEVSVRILRSAEDPSVYRILVPKQKVSGATVRVDSFEESIDIETGEELTEYPPQGWIPVGSSHSHNTMAAFFSGTDDKYELGDPGIHLVVGSIKVDANSYSIAASVVGNGRRFVMHYNNLIDATPVEGVTFHPKVLDYVDDSPYATTYTAKGGAVVPWKSKVGTYSGSNYDSYKYNQWLQKYTFPPEKGYNDPFHYSETYNDRMYGKGREIKYWEVEDILNDYLSQNQDNIEGLIRLENTLKDILTDVEAGVQLIMEGYTSI